MCAILGWAGRAKRGQWPLIHRLLTELFVASACRGTDATGFAALDRRGQMLVDKQPLPSRTFLRSSRAWKRLSSPSLLIGHCRAATHGSPHTGDNRNNHPFFTSDLAAVVNGMNSNYRTLAEDNDLILNSECDSEVILRLVEAARTPPVGLQACLDQLEGGMATAVLDAGNECVWIARNDRRPVWLLRLKGIEGFIACSTREIAEQALNAVFGRSHPDLIQMLVPMASNTIVSAGVTGQMTVARTERKHARCPSLWLA